VAGDEESAGLVMQQMAEDGVHPNDYTFTALLKLYGRTGSVDKAEVRVSRSVSTLDPATARCHHPTAHSSAPFETESRDMSLKIAVSSEDIHLLLAVAPNCVFKELLCIKKLGSFCRFQRHALERGH